jgi:hypothetical protein
MLSSFDWVYVAIRCMWPWCGFGPWLGVPAGNLLYIVAGLGLQKRNFRGGGLPDMVSW